MTLPAGPRLDACELPPRPVAGGMGEMYRLADGVTLSQRLMQGTLGVEETVHDMEKT